MQRDGVGYYRPELDVLRFLAFLFVFLHHAFPSEASAYSAFGEMPANIISSLVVAGGLGVDLFFVLSAFLITKLLLIEEQRTNLTIWSEDTTQVTWSKAAVTATANTTTRP